MRSASPRVVGLLLLGAAAAGCGPRRSDATRSFPGEAGPPGSGGTGGPSTERPPLGGAGGGAADAAVDAPVDLPPIAPPPPRPAWRWGPARKDGCTGEGLRQISAPLRNVPPGMDAAAACKAAPRNVMGIDFASPDRCVDDGGMRGQWDVPDTTCLATPPPAPARGADGQLRSDAPLEGIADLHLHQMSYLGFGGSIVWGAAYGPPEQALTPIPQAMKLGHDRSEALFDGNIAGGVIGLTSHGESGFPGFTSWPSRELATHQQAYEDWLFRAYQAGLRLMVMLAVNSEDMFGRGENDLPLIGGVAIQGVRAPGRSTNDMETLEWQVREAYRMQTYIDARHGGPGKGWYRIVRDPDEASAVIAGGRLAVVLGTELQHLFNCDSDRPACTEATIIEGLNRLEAMGVAHVFPIHHKLNQFGGPTQFNPLTNGPTEECHETEERCSAVGLTPLGKFLVEELTTRGMLIDTEHMSWKALDDALAIVEDRRYPVIASHVGAFDLKADGLNEQVRRTDQLRRMLAVGGMMGVIYGVGAEEYAPSKTAKVQVPISCGGADRWANAYLYLRDLAGDAGLAGAGRQLGGRVTIGSDWNGFASWPAPRYAPEPCQPRAAKDGKPIAKPAPVAYPVALPARLVPAAVGPSAALPRMSQPRVWDYNELGLQHTGLTAEFLEDLRLSGLTLADLEPIYRSARGLVELWRTARDRLVPGDRHHLRWTPRSPFDLLAFEYADAERFVEVAPGLVLCRSRRGHLLGVERNGSCALVEAPPPAPAPAPEEITAYHAGRCLDVDGMSTSDGARVQQYSCNGGANQRWRLRAVDGGRWEIVGMASGRCLQTSGDGAGAGATLGTCAGMPRQRWEAVRTGNTFALRSPNGLCLEVNGDSRSNGASVELAACSGAAYQQWQIESLRAGDHERLYQAGKGRIAWAAAPQGAFVVPVSVDGDRRICRPAGSAAWAGVVSGAECVGRDAADTVVRSARFEQLFQAH